MSRVICTIGFAQKGLRRFVQLLREGGVTRLVDIRLHNTSQLAGFAKRDDLAFICELIGIGYTHLPDLAPTEDMLHRYRKVDRDWPAYEREFLALMARRQAERWLGSELFADGAVNCLLCTEHEPDQCHRRLVAEYWQRFDPDLVIRHLY